MKYLCVLKARLDGSGCSFSLALSQQLKNEEKEWGEGGTEAKCVTNWNPPPRSTSHIFFHSIQSTVLAAYAVMFSHPPTGTFSLQVRALLLPLRCKLLQRSWGGHHCIRSRGRRKRVLGHAHPSASALGSERPFTGHLGPSSWGQGGDCCCGALAGRGKGSLAAPWGRLYPSATGTHLQEETRGTAQKEATILGMCCLLVL